MTYKTSPKIINKVLMLKSTLFVILILFLGNKSIAQAIKVIPQTGHYDAIQSLEFSPDGKLLLSIDVNHKFIIWDLRSGGILHNLREKTGRFSKDGNYVYIDEKILDLRDASTTQGNENIQASDKVTYLQLNKHETIAWNNEEFKSQLRFYSHNRLIQKINPAYLDFLFTDVAFNTNYTFISCEDGRIYVVNNISKKVIKKLSTINIQLTSLAMTPDGNYLAVGNEFGGIDIWNAQSFKIERKLKGKDLNITRAHLWAEKNELFWSTKQGSLNKLALDQTELDILSQNITKSSLPILTFTIDQKK